MRRLIRGGTVITLDSERHIYPGGYVAINGSRIEAVGPASDTPAREAFDEVLDVREMAVLPGLINAHQHLWYTLFKGLGQGLILEDWIEKVLVPAARAITDEDMELSTLLGSLEMLETGTTCAVYHMTTRTTAETIRRVVEAALRSGIRLVIAKEVRPESLQDQLSLAEELVHTWQDTGGGRIRMALVVETTSHWVMMGACSEELVLETHQLAVRHGLRISDHIAGGTLSRDRGYLRFVRETGRTDVQYLHQLGVLDEHWLLVHGIWLTDRDMDLISSSGASLVNCPTSHAMRAGGVTPAKRLLACGVTVALGTDGPMVDNSVDMFEQMKAALMEQNQHHLDPAALTPEQVLEMATVEAARALGMEDQVGSLEPGKLADLIVVDLGRPHVGVVHRPVTSVVTAARGTDVWLTMVGGEVVYRAGRFAKFHDFGALRREGQRRAKDLVEAAGLTPLATSVWPVVG